MSTNSSIIQYGFELIKILEVIAHNSHMGHDTNWDPNKNLWFLAKRRYPYEGSNSCLEFDLWLRYSEIAAAWFVARFLVGCFEENSHTMVWTQERILDGSEILRYFAKEPVRSPSDLQNPGSNLWRIHSPANIVALIGEYENLARINGCLSVFSLYPEQKEDKQI